MRQSEINTPAMREFDEACRLLDVGSEELQCMVRSVAGRTIRIIRVISDQYIWSVRSDRTGQQITGAVSGLSNAIASVNDIVDQVAR